MTTIKLGTLIGVLESKKPQLKALVNDYGKFFKNNGSKFIGSRTTYVVEGDAIDDDPKKRKNVRVTTTVDEKMSWLIQEAENPINLMLTQEATNASGKARAELVVDGISMGEYSSLELLKMKSILGKDIGNLYDMFSTIPVRDDAVDWKRCESEQYADRKIYETEKVTFKEKTTNKESYILTDPHASLGRAPQTSVRNITTILGESSRQEFSGEWTTTQRADVLKRYNTLQAAIVKALKEANDVEVVEVDAGLKILSYLLLGQI